MASYARQEDRFRASGLSVAAICVDSVEQNRAMAAKLLLWFPVLSDPEGEVIRAYGVWNPNEGGIALPALFLVRPDSSVAFSQIGGDFADRPEDGALFAAAGEGR